MLVSDNDPFTTFESWYSAAKRTEPDVPDAMQLATCLGGRPSVRTVLLKDYGRDGFQFFTNAGSRKGQELVANPYAATVFHWKSQQQQVRIEGQVAVETSALSDAYFASRDRASQIGAWASNQSAPMPDRATLEAAVARYTAQFEGKSVARPPGWGGFRIHPDRFEFWQGRPNRLHDRLAFVRGGGGWAVVRLGP